MDRRQIDDIEAERGDLGQPRDAIVERAVAARHRALAARHHLVPGAGARPRPVDDRPGSAMLRVRSPRGSLAATASASSSASRISTSGRGRTARRARSMIRLMLASRGIQLAEKFAAFLGLKRDILAGLALEQQCFAPGGELVGPGFDREQVAAGLGRGELAVPAVVAVRDASARAASRSSDSFRHSSSAASWSWPSRSKSAQTSMGSPAMRLIG